jgi:FemAB-related protein (PEP-CTERM system-associated)
MSGRFAGLQRVAGSPGSAVHTDHSPSLRISEEADRNAADAYVDAHPQASAYHHRSWLDIVGQAFGHPTKYLVAEAPRGIVGVLPLVFFRSPVFGRFTVSMPFFNYGGVLADTPGTERALLDRAIAETRAAGGSHLELRHVRQHFPDLMARRHKVAMALPLAHTVEQQWQTVDRKVRNQVRKAEKSGLQTVVGGAELLKEFYEVFARNMRDLGTPVYGRRFFSAILERCPGCSRLIVVRAAGRPAAAAFVHWHGSTMEVPWASAIRDFNPLCANTLLYWEMVRFAVARGLRTFDMGRSTPDEGTYQFKRQWGAEPRELVWEYWTAAGHAVPELNPKNPKFGLAIKAWQHLPVPVASAIGPWVVRNIP